MLPALCGLEPLAHRSFTAGTADARGLRGLASELCVSAQRAGRFL